MLNEIIELELDIYDHKLTIPFDVEYGYDDTSNDPHTENRTPILANYKIDSSNELKTLTKAMLDCYYEEDLIKLLQNKLDEVLND